VAAVTLAIEVEAKLEIAGNSARIQRQ
jgi:hypothetical protein